MSFNPGEIDALGAEQFQVFLAPRDGMFRLVSGLQSQEPSITHPSDDVDQLGDELHRGSTVKTPEITTSFTQLLIDKKTLELFAGRDATLGALTHGGDTAFDTEAEAYVKNVSPAVFSSSVPSGSTITLEVTDGTGGGEKYKIKKDTTDLLTDCELDKPYYILEGVEIIVRSLTATDWTLAVGDTATFTVTEGSTMSQSDLRGGRVDCLVVARDQENDNIFKIEYATNLDLQSDGFSFDKDGNSQLTFSCDNDNHTEYDAYVIRRAYIASSEDNAVTTLDLDAKGVVGATETPLNLLTSGYNVARDCSDDTSKRYLIKVSVEDIVGDTTYLTPSTSAAPSAGEYSYDSTTKTIKFGTALATGDRIQVTFVSVAYDATDEGTAFGYERYPREHADFDNTPVAITGDYVPVKIGANQLDRVQSANVNIAFNKERLTKMGYTNYVHDKGKIPTITGDFAVLDGDLELLKLIRKGSTTSTDTELSANESSVYTNTNDLELKIEIKDPADNVTVLITITVPDIQIISETLPKSVGTNTTRTFNFKSKTGRLDID